MNRVLRFYNYEKCFEYYTQCIFNLRQAKINGEVIVAKPVLMLALLDGVNDGEFVGNNFSLTDWLEVRYLSLMRKYTKDSQFDDPSSIYNPFWHLHSDGFWHLHLKKEREGRATPSTGWLKENVSSARFDDDLWVLLQNREWRMKLRDFIVEKKLTK
ncbi:MAG: hypothetical protein IKW98_10590 [Prevotella sp.]|nr:hypothetical protein [Prevotella sp.]